MKRAFTLIEVNLAMLIMAGGILSLVGLYAFGFRESKQSREDVESAAIADAYISPLVMAISATNLKWSAFRQVESIPSDKGWAYYLDNEGRVKQNPNGPSQFSKAMSAYSGCAVGGDRVSYSQPTEKNLLCGLVVLHEENSSIVRIGFRAAPTKDQLMSMPLYYTEVRFQGIIDQ